MVEAASLCRCAALLSSLPSRCLSTVLRFPEKPWCCRRFRRIHPLATTKPAKWSPCGPQSPPLSHLPEDNDASKTAKLLRTPLAVLDVLTAPRLLRSPITAIGVPRYDSGWELAWPTSGLPRVFLLTFVS